jgi:hypothetical protein
MSISNVGFDPNDGILYTRSADNTNLDDMLRGIGGLMSNSALPRNLRILEDGRGIHITFPVKDIAVLVDRLSSALDEYSSIRHAVIHDDPINTAFAVLIGLQVKHEKYELKVFSTYAAARNWVLG